MNPKLKERFVAMNALLDPRRDVHAVHDVHAGACEQHCFNMPPEGPVNDEEKERRQKYWEKEEDEVMRAWQKAYEQMDWTRGPCGNYTGGTHPSGRMAGGWKRRKVSRRKNQKRKRKRKRTY